MMKKQTMTLKIYMMLLALAVVFLSGLPVRAEEDFTSEYTQKDFSEEDGFASRQANCICQSTSGYIWVGTDSGLYRYDGSTFRLFSMDQETDGSIYSINCILLSSTGNLYVGTENYGLFMYDTGGFTRVSSTYNEGIATINDIYEDKTGTIWLATNSGIYELNGENLRSIDYSVLTGSDIIAIDGYQDEIYAIANNDTLVKLKNGVLQEFKNRIDYRIDEVNCLYVDEEGIRYYGTAGRNLLKINPDDTFEVMSTGSLRGINKVMKHAGAIWILADNGVAYFRIDNELVYISALEFNDSMSDMLFDYEGNCWFTSYRKGLLFLEKSRFKNLSVTYGMNESIVNCVIMRNGELYIGTDEGLTIVGRDGEVITDNEIVNLLSGISIRDFMVDSHGRLWIGTYNIYGVVEVSNAGNYQYYNRGDTGLVSNAVNCICELQDGSVAVGTENGISCLKDGEVIKNYTRADGLGNTDIISLYQDKNGILYAGSNGGGMYSIDLESNVKKVAVEEGLTLNVISAITGGANGLWIGTDNGLYYQEGVIRQISTVDSSNSIYDIHIDKDGYLWLFGSRGVFRYYENDLLSSAQPASLSLTKNEGIISDITELSSNYIARNGTVYVCCDEGLCSVNPDTMYVNTIPPQVRISSVSVDGTEYSFSELNGKIKVPGNTSRITIKFSVLSYVNRSKVQIQYYLDGFEDEYRVLSGNDLLEAEYTNIEGGTYQFVLTAQNADGVPSERTVAFEIQKELKFWETDFSRMMIALGIIVLLLLVIFVFRVVDRILKRKNQQVEELSKKSEEALKSNQAKNDYVNYLSHEIRAPLNSILAISEMMLRNKEDQDAEQAEQLSMMYESSYEILGIVDGIVRLSNLRDGSIEMVPKEYAVSDVIAELSEKFKTMVNRELIELKVSIEDDLPNGLIGDIAKLKEIVTNIYSRAVSTTKEGYISIEMDWRKCKPGPDAEDAKPEQHDGIYLDFVISDSGIGVKEERIDSFFEIDDTYDRDDIGKFDISVGLAIARQLIDMMEGDAEVTSIYGAGTTVKFSVKQEVFDYSYVNYNANRKKELARRDSNSRIWLPDVRVLLVDDSEVGLQVAKALFDTYELVCDTATSGFDALDKIMINQYDLVFIDTVMPVMDGKDTVREIRNLDGDEYSQIPAIAMSENNVDASREDILSAGFDEILVKPLEMDEIEEIFRRFIPQDKIMEKIRDIKLYITESEFKDDIQILSNYISVENALKMMGGNFDTFNRLIKAYKEDYEEQILSLSDYLDSDVRRYKHIIHDIKSNSSNISANRVERKAANLEASINIGNMQYARENTKEFVSLMKEMFQAIDRYLGQIAHQEKPQKKEYRDSINRAKMKEMRAYLKEGQAKPVKQLMEEIDRYSYSDIDTEFLDALKMTIDDMDYQGASEIIDQYLNSV